MNAIFKYCIAALLIFESMTAFSQTLAFPEALGFGRLATGGRAGTVYHVTNLNDSGAGSFRDAVSVSNRIVVFDVGGYITLKTAVSCKSNLTIAGQTAPGGGIGFRGGEISFAKQSNIICRGIRIRPGSETASTTDDALSIYLANNAIFDHCSFEFAPWNNIDGVGDNSKGYLVTNISFMNCLIADPTGQQFGAHCESVNSDWSWFYNIFANSHNRNPLEKVNDIFVNNVNYNYSAAYTTHTSTNFKHDIINNYFVMGPASTGTDNTWFQVDKNQSIYYSGNQKDKTLDGTLNGSETTPYWYQGAGTILTAPWSALTKTATIYSAATAFRLTSSFAGTFPYDQLDSLIISQVRTVGGGTTGYGVGTRGPASGLYTSQAQTGLPNNGYGNIYGGTRPTDTDNDGMPDFWELANGSKVNTNDAMTKAADGYALIEKYINWLGALHAQTNQNTFVDINLKNVTGGFQTVSPSYTTSAATNGTAALQANGYTVRFTPTANFSGMASFKFTVKGNDGTEYSATVAVAVVPSNVVVTSKNFVYEYDNSTNFNWTNTNSWTPKALPTALDTAIIRTGEVSVSADVASVTAVETNGVFRLRANVAVPKLILQGGVLKSYTSNPLFVLTTALVAEDPSTLTVGSTAASVFEIDGTISGSGTLIKNSNGVLQINASAAAFKGNWIVEGGVLQAKSSSALGLCGVVLQPKTTLDVAVACSTYSLVLKDSAKLNLGANLTVQAAVFDTITLAKGTYTAANYPKYITGTGTLTVGGTLLSASKTASQLSLTAATASSYAWFKDSAQIATGSSYAAVTDGSYYVLATNSNGCQVSSESVGFVKILSQSIALQKGWNLISINVIPDTTIAGSRDKACLVSTLFAGLDVVEIKDMNSFWRKGQVDVFNGLKAITPGNGYLVNMNSAGTLSVAGTPVQTQFIASPQSANWNLIGCPYQSAYPISPDYDETNCSAIKNFEGFWIPNGTANSLQNFEVGKGYFIKK